jgi:hypothetical protein
MGFNMKKYTIILLILLLIIPTISWTACTGSSPSWSCPNGTTAAELQTTIDSASTGDTITFSASGSSTFTAQVTVNKAVTIVGNGTTITTSGSISSVFHITGFTADATQVRITGFTISAASATYVFKVTDMTGGVSKGNIRIDHNTIHFSDTQFYFYHGKGLIDHNTCYNPSSKFADISGGSITNQTEAWASMSAGTADAIFFESNSFIHDANCSSALQEGIGTDGGAKLVIRYNTFNFADMAVEYRDQPMTPIMLHGSHDGYWEANSDNRRGQSVVEIYNNTFSAYKFAQIIVLRGSASLVYSNTATYTSSSGYFIYMREEEFEVYGEGQSNWVTQRTAWPAEDQVHNTFFWLNTLQGTSINTSHDDYFVAVPACSSYPASCTAGLQRGRDYFLHKPCAAAASTDGTVENNTCTHGIEKFVAATDCTSSGYAGSVVTACCTGEGVGATCSNGSSAGAPAIAGGGEAYTDKGTMYFTSTGDNAYYNYTAYTYPHPLIGEADSTAPTTTISTSNSTITVNSLTVTGTSVDAVGVSGCKYRLGSAPDAGNGTACTGTTSFSCTTAGYSSGSNTIYVGCYDAAGNYGSDSITVTFIHPTISGGISISGGSIQ